MARDGKQLNIRIPHDLHAQLVAAAKASGRSVTAHATMSLRVALYPMTDAGDWRRYVIAEIARKESCTEEGGADLPKPVFFDPSRGNS